MTAAITMPQLGESVAEGMLGRWLKPPGDRIEKDEPIAEIITDKVNAELPSPVAGGSSSSCWKRAPLSTSAARLLA